jgi:hypothetical protein
LINACKKPLNLWENEEFARGLIVNEAFLTDETKNVMKLGRSFAHPMQQKALGQVIKLTVLQYRQ